MKDYFLFPISEGSGREGSAPCCPWGPRLMEAALAGGCIGVGRQPGVPQKLPDLSAHWPELVAGSRLTAG